MVFRTALLSLLLFTSASCAVGIRDAPMDWLIGDWSTQDGAITEQWRAVSSQTLEGVGTTTSKDKVTTESLRLVRMGDGIFFIAKVPHNDVPVAFRLTGESTPERAIFSNPAHDFPKQIVYEQDGRDGLIVTVSDGGTEGFQLHFTRN